MASEQWESSAYTGGEVQIRLRYNEATLVEVESVEYKVTRSGRPGGAGIGFPRNTYHKFGVPSGTWKIAKGLLNHAIQGDLFAELLAGTTAVQTESFASGAATLAVAQNPTYIMTVVVTGAAGWEELVEGTGYTVAYATDTITFVGNASESGYVIYTSDAVALVDDDAMDGTHMPLMFDIEWIRRSDSVVLKMLRGCAPYEHAVTSGGVGEEPFSEDLSGEFLYLETSA